MQEPSLSELLGTKMAYELKYRKDLKNFVAKIIKRMRVHEHDTERVRRMTIKELQDELARRNRFFQTNVYKEFVSADVSIADIIRKHREWEDYRKEAADMLKYLRPDVPVQQALQATGEYLRKYSKMYGNFFTQNAAERARMDSALTKTGGQMAYKGWVSLVDGQERPTHLVAHNLYSTAHIPLNVPFTVAAQRLMYPGDMGMGASGDNVHGCRCAATYWDAGGNRIGV